MSVAENKSMATQQSDANGKSGGKKAKKYKAPDYLREMNIIEKLENHQIIQNMNKRINYLKNPRFAIVRPPIKYKDLDTKPQVLAATNEWSCQFRAVPQVVLFQDYMINQVYEIPLSLTNVSNMSRRIKYQPPANTQFTIKSIKYPQQIPQQAEDDKLDKHEYGLIAPGMSVVFQIAFHATSFAEFNDELAVFCDEKAFKIPILAKKEPPQINLPEMLDCQSCWLGDRADMVFRVNNKGGEAGFKFFCEQEEDDAKQTGEVIKLNNFTVCPSEFFIQKGEIVEIYVSYNPVCEGLTQEKVILACDNHTSAAYTLQGKGNMAELSVYGIDDLQIEEFAAQYSSNVQKIFFPDAFPNETVTRKLLIRNKTQVKVKYHWSVFKTDRRSKQFILENEADFNFKIEPDQGTFKPDEILSFKISFNSKLPIAVFEYASLFIDDIPWQSIRNPPESLKKSLEESAQENPGTGAGASAGTAAAEQQKPAKNGVANGGNGVGGGVIQQQQEMPLSKPGFFGSNSTRPSISYYEFELIGLGNYCKVEVEPQFYYFPYNLYIGKVYKRVFTLINKSKCKISFTVKQFKVSGSHITTWIQPNKGVLEPNGKTEVEVGFAGTRLEQYQKAIFMVDFDYAHSKSLELIGNFIGPSVRLADPIINFGLIRGFAQSSCTLMIENTSEVEAEVLFKNADNKEEFTEYLASYQRQKELELEKKMLKEEEGEDQLAETFLKDAEKEGSCIVSFEPMHCKLNPNEKKQIKVNCLAKGPETSVQIFECMVHHAESQFIQSYAEIQNVHVSLNRYSIDFECLFAGNTYELKSGKSEQWIELQNLGNIASEFKWEMPIGSKNGEFLVKFEPISGVIQPKSRIPISITLVPQKGGTFNQIFVCECQGLEYPLGFEIVTQVLGLTVDYELVDLHQQVSENPGSTKNASISINNDLLQPQLPGTTRLPGQKYKLGNTAGIRASNSKKDLHMQSMQGPSGRENTQRTKGMSTEEMQLKSQKLEKLEFYGCTINQPKSMKILIRNTSGINTQYNLYVEKFMPYLLNDQRSLYDSNSLTEETGGERKIKFSQTAKTSDGSTVMKKSKKRDSQLGQGRPPQLLSDDLEKRNNFTSASGQQLNATRRLERDQRIYLTNNKGIAILCEPWKGQLAPYSEVFINITVFNDICGLFEDYLCCEIKGMELKKFPFVIDVKGTPVVISPNQLGIDYKSEYPFYHLGYYQRNCPPVTRDFRILNTGPKDIEIEWKMYNLDEDTEEQKQQQTAENEKQQLAVAPKNYFEIKIQKPPLGSDKVALLEFVPIEPPQALNGPFKLNSYKDILKGRREKQYQITFQSSQNREFNSIIICKPKLIEHPDVKVGILALNIKVETIWPHLHFDKLLTVEGKHKIKFEKWSLGNAKKEHKKICFINQQKSSLIFNVSIDGPFKLEEANTNSPAKYDLLATQQLSLDKKQPIMTSFNLVPNSNLELQLALEGPNVKQTLEWPMTAKVYKFGLLTVTFSNGDTQTFDLEGILLRPSVSLNTSGHEGVQGQEIQDFGIVHINNKKTIAIFLSNSSKVPAKWSLCNVKVGQKKNLSSNTMTKMELEEAAKTDDSSVFEFSITEGVLNGPSIPVKSLPDTSALPTEITKFDNQDANLYPQKILINFRPKRNVLYKSKYRITVEEGENVDFVLRGTGTYDEHHEK